MGRGHHISEDSQALLRADEHSGDGWVVCDLGHDHWGRYGAAGLLLRHVDQQGISRFLLGRRSPETHHGETYSTPGGALDFEETPLEGATREGVEELGLAFEFEHEGTQEVDHGGWAYYTVHGRVQNRFSDFTLLELEEAGWYTKEEVDSLPLHPGFHSYWQRYRTSL